MSASPRVGLDVRMWHHTGIGRYIRELWSRLPAHDVRLVPYGPPNVLADLDQPGIPLEAPLHSIREQVALGLAIGQHRPDLFHAPHITAPLACPVPLVTTIHDLIPLHVPVLGRIGTAYVRTMGTRLVPARSRRILTVSAFTRDDLVARGVPAERITVTPLGVDPAFGVHVPRDRLAALRARHDLPDKYLLHVGQWKPHKGLATVLQAMARLTREGTAVPPLVQLGRPDPRHDIRPLAVGLGIGHLLRNIPGLPDEADVRGLYQNALAFLFPSRIEGFGLPPLEAMAAGIPVVADTGSATAETLAGACIEARWDDVVAWQNALRAVLGDAGLRTRLAGLGRERADRFTWEHTARLTAETYHRVHAHPESPSGRSPS